MSAIPLAMEYGVFLGILVNQIPNTIIHWLMCSQLLLCQTTFICWCDKSLTMALLVGYTVLAQVFHEHLILQTNGKSAVPSYGLCSRKPS